jgi:hypothetical protein
MLLDTIQFFLPNKKSTLRVDRIIWVAFLALMLVLVEAILTAGTCAIIQSLLDSLSTNFTLNIKVAVYSMAVVGALLIVIDITLAALWLNFLLCRTARVVSPTMNTAENCLA